MKELSAYYQQGQSWEEEIYLKLRLSEKRAWMVAASGGVIALLALGTLIAVLPLKSFEPYVITVDKHTGYVETTRGLREGDFTQEEAVTDYYLVKYVTAREAYNPAVLEENYIAAQALSAGDAQKEHKILWDGSNPENPSKRYGYEGKIDIGVKSVSLLNEKTASVRFVRTVTENGQKKDTHWNAIVTFQYVSEPEKTEIRFINPLGFRVLTYRMTQEILEK